MKNKEIEFNLKQEEKIKLIKIETLKEISKNQKILNFTENELELLGLTSD